MVASRAGDTVVPKPRRSHRGARLFAVFAGASLIPVVALGLVLVRDYHNAGVAHALEQGRAQAAVIEQVAISTALPGNDLSEGLTDDQRGRLQSATELAVVHGSVQRLRLLDFNGHVVFYEEGTARSAGFRHDDPAFRAAASGRVDVRMVGASGPPEAVGIRVLQPIRPHAAGRAVGVLEVVLPYDEIAEQVQTDTRAAISRLVLGLLGLYAVVALISFWTTRALCRYAAHNEYQALHDPLTGLANRELFQQVAGEALQGGRGSGSGALALVDLDHFKEVNDSLGHHAGDELLRVVAGRLTESLRPQDTVARLGGDEFGIFLPDSDRDEVLDLLTHARQRIGEPIHLDGTTLSVEASFGVCFHPQDASDLEDLLQHADAAMYQAKRGTSGVVLYQPGSVRPIVDALVVQNELRRALARDELELHYQPKIELGSGRIAGVEALVRWRHPERGLLAPGQFLAVAERCELIEPLTRWVLREALADLVEWTSIGMDWGVSVNVSARNLSSTSFAEDVADLLAEASVPAHRLCLEITETALAVDGKVAGHVLAALAAQGLSLALDDFGVGFTGISQLRGLAMAEIKIDRLFVAGLPHNDQDRAIVSSVIDLAHDLGCTVTAEGVEDLEAAAWLRGAGCDFAQGYLWLRPAPWPEVAALASTVTALTVPSAESDGIRPERDSGSGVLVS